MIITTLVDTRGAEWGHSTNLANMALRLTMFPEGTIMKIFLTAGKDAHTKRLMHTLWC